MRQERSVPCIINLPSKALANDIAILEFAIQTPQHLTYLGWTFAAKLFSACALYHPQEAWDKKSSVGPSTLGTWRTRRNRDGFFVRVLSGLRMGGIKEKCLLITKKGPFFHKSFSEGPFWFHFSQCSLPPVSAVEVMIGIDPICLSVCEHSHGQTVGHTDTTCDLCPVYSLSMRY